MPLSFLIYGRQQYLWVLMSIEWLEEKLATELLETMLWYFIRTAYLLIKLYFLGTVQGEFFNSFYDELKCV